MLYKCSFYLLYLLTKNNHTSHEEHEHIIFIIVRFSFCVVGYNSSQRTTTSLILLFAGSSVEETGRGGGHGTDTEDLRVGNRRQPQETVHGRLYIRIYCTMNAAVEETY